MVVYIFLVAALNLGLGLGVAVYLGRLYRGVNPDDGPWARGARPEQSFDDVLAGREELAAGLDILAERPPRQQSAEPTEEASETTTGPQPEETPAAESPPDTPPDDSPGQKSVEDLRSGSQRYHEQVTLADEKLQACAEAPDAAEIAAVLGSLEDSTRHYLEDRNQTHGSFKEHNQGRPEIGGIGDDLEAAIEREDRQIAGTRAMIEGFDYEGDLGEGCRRASQQAGKLIGSIDQLQGMLDEVKLKLKLKLAENERQPQKVDPAAQSDAPTENSGQTELEAELMDALGKDFDQAKSSSVSIIELNDFAELEKQHGQEVAEKIVPAVFQLLESGGGGEDSLLQLSQQRFLLRSAAADVQLAANAAERLRQTVEKAILHHDGTEIRVTVSCAVVAATLEEPRSRLVQRAEATLQEAKRYGNNRTFMHDGKYPTPVVPPSFSLEEKQITL